MEEQVVALYAGVNGYLDDIPTEQGARASRRSSASSSAPRATILRTIRESSDLADDTTAKLNAAIEKFKAMFNVESAAS